MATAAAGAANGSSPRSGETGTFVTGELLGGAIMPLAGVAVGAGAGATAGAGGTAPIIAGKAAMIAAWFCSMPCRRLTTEGVIGGCPPDGAGASGD